MGRQILSEVLTTVLSTILIVLVCMHLLIAIEYFLSDLLTAVFFETGAMPVPTKSLNPTICGSGDPFHSYLAHS